MTDPFAGLPKPWAKYKLDLGQVLRRTLSRAPRACDPACARFRLGARLLGAGLLSNLLLPLGCCLFAIPPLAATAAACYVVVPCIVLERIGIRAALQRCQALTAGYHGDIFTAFTATAGLRALCRPGATSLSPLLSQSLDSAKPMALGIEGALALVAVLLGSIATVTPVVVYNDLRANREGADLEQLVQISSSRGVRRTTPFVLTPDTAPPIRPRGV